MIWWEIVLFFGAPLLWGAWELYSLRRDRRTAQAPILHALPDLDTGAPPHADDHRDHPGSGRP